MIWKKAVIIATIGIAIILASSALWPAPGEEIRQDTHLQLSAPSEIPFLDSFAVNGLAISGEWRGSGFAQVWLVGEGREYLVLDTRNSPSAYRFERACIDTCSIPSLQPESVLVAVTGGTLSIDTYHYDVPEAPAGLAVCKNCKRIRQARIPDHSLLLIVLTLVIAVIGAHSLSHCCQNPRRKKMLIVVFIGGFVALTAVFGASLAAPTAAFAVTTKKSASVFAAFALISLFAIIMMELRISHKKYEPPQSDVWKEIEEAEESWKKSK